VVAVAVIKLVEDYAISQLRKDVRDGLMTSGEQAVLLQLFHAGDPDAVTCPQCGDPVYKSPESDCLSCYGTMFNGGVRQAMKVWALFTDYSPTEQLGPRGSYQPDQRSAQFEAFPLVTEHDVIARVSSWAADGTPAELYGFYILQQVTRRSLRTGNRFGQSSIDVVGQKAQLSELSGTIKMIQRYPIVGQSFAIPTQTSAPILSGLPELLAQRFPQAQEGRHWWFGQGPPPPSGVAGSSSGDFYLDTTTGNVYELEGILPPTISDANQVSRPGPVTQASYGLGEDF